MACAGLAASGWTYDIVGRGPLGDDLERLTRELALADVVRFRGVLSLAAIAQELLDASIALLSSRTASDGDTERPVFLIESAVRGLPIVSARHAIPELLQTEAAARGYQLEERDVAGIAAALRRLADAAAERRERARACGAHARALFSSEAHTHALTAALEEAVRSHAVPVPRTGVPRA